VFGYLDMTLVPENIEIVIVEKIDETCIELEKDVYEKN
jgi:hypothetical protein